MSTEIITHNPQDLLICDPVPMDQNPAAVYLAKLSTIPGRRVMRDSLDTIADLVVPGSNALCFPWASLRFQHTAVIRAKLLERYNKPATINRCLCALRGTLKAAWRLGQMSSEDYYRARDVESVTGDTIPAGRELSGGEIHGLMAACQNDPSLAGIRDGAIIALMYAAGPRRAEVVSIDVKDVEQLDGGIIKIKIIGKRSKERIIYADNGAAGAMADWLTVRGSEPGPLFQPINKGGKIKPGRMTSQAIYNMLKKRGDQAGVAIYSPHDLRRTFVSDLLDAGADIATVAKMAGHANVATTARYDRRPELAKQKAASLLHVPYRRRAL